MHGPVFLLHWQRNSSDWFLLVFSNLFSFSFFFCQFQNNLVIFVFFLFFNKTVATNLTLFMAFFSVGPSCLSCSVLIYPDWMNIAFLVEKINIESVFHFYSNSQSQVSKEQTIWGLLQNLSNGILIERKPPVERLNQMSRPSHLTPFDTAHYSELPLDDEAYHLIS